MNTRCQIYSYYERDTQQISVEYNFCPYCQKKLESMESGGQERPTRPNCSFIHYRNPLPSVCVVILEGDRILLGKRAAPPGEGLWAIPSGYIEFEDDYINTAIQEAKEETGLDVKIQSIFNVLSSFYSPKYHFLVIYVISYVVGGELQAGNDMAEVAWFPIQGPLPELAFREDVDALKVLAQGEFEVLPISLDQPDQVSQR
jgi:ADP-ribose pyrophosphatase YjhB (NUDIX family)